MNQIEREFSAFFEAIHEREPFPWQTMLAWQVIESGWPDVIELPTAAGKTACVDVAVFALAHWAASNRKSTQPARRIWFVVDRRIVVDEAFNRAGRIADAIAERRELHEHARALCDLSGSKMPLAVSRLRGGVPRERAWSGNPAQPVILTSTVDQIGSRLLFRGYGAAPRRWPMDAALAGNDSLIILDEAHCAQPFMQTIGWVKKLQGHPFAARPLNLPLRLTVMSATPPADPPDRKLTRFPSNQAERDKALDHKLLKKRGQASKLAALVAIKKEWKPPKNVKLLDQNVDGDQLARAAAQLAADFADSGRRRIAVMVNRIATARDIADRLRRGLGESASVELMIGRMRPIDRDALVERLSPMLKAGSSEPVPKPVVLVTTQCLEVGADYSFDAMVTECASLDALRQRFGRLDRLGDHGVTQAQLLIREADVTTDEKKSDPIYGLAMSRTWGFLNKHAEKGVIDMGVAALGKALQNVSADLNAPTREAPVLLPAYVDMLSQTNPQPAIEPDISLFLHGMPKAGERSRPEVQVLWRADLLNDDEVTWADRVEDYPPLSAEMLTLPLSEFAAALHGNNLPEGADIEGEAEKADDDRRRDNVESLSRAYVVYRAGKAMQGRHAGRVRPGDIIVLPASSDLLARYLPTGATRDLFELAHHQARGAIKIRLEPAVLKQWIDDGAVQALNSLLDSGDAEVSDELIAHLKGSARADDRLLKRWKAMLDARPLKLATDDRGHRLLTSRPLPESPIAWETDDDELLSDGDGGKYLLQHLQCVAAAAVHLTKPARAMIELAFGQVIERTAELHDIGKADPRMQTYLAGQRRAVAVEKLLAKSARTFIKSREKKLRQWAGQPDGFRHEVLSMQMAAGESLPAEQRDLLLHLIGSHHGFCRGFPPIVEDDNPPALSLKLGDVTWQITTDRRQQDATGPLAADVANRFWRLTREHGWWGLAYLELLVRSADQYASSEAT